MRLASISYTQRESKQRSITQDNLGFEKISTLHKNKLNINFTFFIICLFLLIIQKREILRFDFELFSELEFRD